MKYFNVELVWKASEASVSPAVAVRFDVIRAENKEQAKRFARVLLDDSDLWEVVRVVEL